MKPRNDSRLAAARPEGALQVRATTDDEVRSASAGGAQAELAALTMSFKHAALFEEPRDWRPLVKALRADLADVKVLGAGGKVVDFDEKLATETSLGRAQKTRILRALALVRATLLRLDAAIAPNGPHKGYQIVNWKHTRTELDQVLEAAKIAMLPPAGVEDALLASMFSDAVKSPENFIVHNVDGAAAAAAVLSRFFDATVKKNLERLVGIATIIKEHQIGPPLFMATILKGQLTRKIKERGREDAATAAVVVSIAKKVGRPFEPSHLTADGSKIELTREERQLLKLVGIDEWWVPHPTSSWYGASRAVIDGDSLINYASPDGWAKIAALRGPDTQPFFEDPTVFESLQSAKRSYDDAMTVISPAARPLAEAGLTRTKTAVRRMRDAMRAWFAAQSPFLPANPDGSIAFWNAPLKYPSQGPFERREQEQFNFAKRIRERVVEILRAEQNVY